MAKKLKVLCVHGLGDQRQSGWEADWQRAVEEAVGQNSGAKLEFHFVSYDPIFADIDISFAETLGAFWKLARSGIGSLHRRSRGGLSNIPDRLRWTAGYVVAWLEDDVFRKKTRALLLNNLRDFSPDVILAHSLGSLVTYDAFAHSDAAGTEMAAALKKAHYVTLGSQLGNPFVLGNLTHGRVHRLGVGHWHHLYNLHDDVFTAPLRVQGLDNFTQLLTPFDIPGWGDHAAPGYLAHQVTRASFWSPVVDRLSGSGARLLGPNPWSRPLGRTKRDKRRRALLIGIDNYPNEEDRLHGCVNDVFSMSATLQDCGFEPEDIRTCLNERATGSAILSRLEWLVDEARAGDELVFYYSGHGARVPEYGLNSEPDRLTETLVPYDFDWTPETGVSDEQICSLYSQLPYEVRLLMIFDCCHSGSMHRQSGGRARGISPPDDIRHRELAWNREEEMWVERGFSEFNRAFSSRKGERREFFGQNLATVRLGRAASLRINTEKAYEKAKKANKGPVGPFLPLIIESCGEDQLAYEYRHGATSYGAFTFCLASILRKEKDITFQKLVDLAGERLARLGYQQTPQILGPKVYVSARVPFETGRGGEEPRGALPGAFTPRTSG